MRIYVLDVTVLTFILSRCSLSQRDNNFGISYIYMFVYVVCVYKYIYFVDLRLRSDVKE